MDVQNSNLNANVNILSEQLIENSNGHNVCPRFPLDDLVYYSSEQYLILCLKLCNLIIKNDCNIRNLIDFDSYIYVINNRNHNVNTNSSGVENKISNLNVTKPLKAKYSTPQSLTDFDTSLLISNYSATNSLFSLNLNPPELLSHLNETECAKYAHKESYKLSLFVFGIVLCVLIILLNSLTLLTILKTRKLHNITNVLIANLSVSDFLSGIAFLYPCILNLLTINALETYNSHLYTLACNIRQYYYLCLAGYSPMITSMLSSMFTLTLLAFEKYVAILHPYLYDRLINEYENKNYLLYGLLLFTWAISIFVSLLPIMGWNEHNKFSSYRGFNCINSKSMPCMFEKIFTLDYILLFTSICLLCAITMLAIYIKIYLVARKHSKQIAKIHSVISTNNTSHNHSTHNHSQINQSMRVNSINKSHLDEQTKNNNDKFEMVQVDQSENNNQPNYFIIGNSSNSLDSPKNNLKKNVKLSESANRLNLNIIHVNSSSASMSALNMKKMVQKNSKYKFYLSSSFRPFEKGSELSPSMIGKDQDQHLNISSDEDKNKTKTFQASISGANGDEFCFSHNSQATSSSSTTKSINMNMKAMKTLLILLLGFYVCWLPLIIYFLTFASKKYNNMTIYILMFFACCNAVIDPIVYAFRNKEFYKALMFNFNFKFRNQNNTINNNNNNSNINNNTHNNNNQISNEVILNNQNK